ncbi:hypothetical protein PN36_15445 [Candidatus Thiomargarita nelsonii]|uniref:Uncharacterized protein n=1 Tax=Candidatus Thiomargarita nelsonii TaxID=1003181 RepID=A0A4E0QT83_9GAMM|nr:hypothetical protein PN36_15445 [Candidatus Thiomargarita nelsonii]
MSKFAQNFFWYILESKASALDVTKSPPQTEGGLQKTGKALYSCPEKFCPAYKLQRFGLKLIWMNETKKRNRSPKLRREKTILMFVVK